MCPSTREAVPMDILLLIAITFAAGVVGGLVLADAFDLEKM